MGEVPLYRLSQLNSPDGVLSVSMGLESSSTHINPRVQCYPHRVQCYPHIPKGSVLTIEGSVLPT